MDIHMELWTEYEGRTINGAIALKKLLQPQGRSAFFSTTNGKGEPRLIRLVACHFDEDEIQARWRGVHEMHHPNFLELEQHGQLELDDTKVVYALFERTDANLADVIQQGRLSEADTRQLAVSLCSALDMLHSNGFIHEHVQAESVYAVGEVVKLRTDCIRETPEGEEGAAAKRQDVRDMATLVLQALTQERSLEAAAVRRRIVPGILQDVVRKGISGEWGLLEIQAALRGAQGATAPRTLPNAETRVTPGRGQAQAKTAGKSAGAGGGAGLGSAAAVPAAGKVAAKERKDADGLPSSIHSEVRLRDRRAPEYETWLDDPRARKWVGAVALLLVVLIWVGWSAMRSSIKAKAEERSPEHARVSHSAPLRGVTAGKQHVVVKPQAAKPHEEWRVVAYTYDRKEQAEKKAADMAQRYPALQASVFTPNGRKPYLVTIGGAMEKQQAYALARRSHGMGLPHDTYAQNYRETSQ